MNPHTNFNFHLSSAAAQQLPPPPPPPPQGIHPGPASSPTQSVPGRRTPLGTVGIGGFYAQGSLMAPSSHSHTDENQPGGSRERFVFDKQCQGKIQFNIKICI